MKYVFRVDSSKDIGSGHVMRCMTLARELVNRGQDVFFVCRRHEGDLNSFLLNQGFEVQSLPQGDPYFSSSKIFHSSWLTVPWELDAEETKQRLTKGPTPDWLIVDHYSIDQGWENYILPLVKKIMVIDDLGDRAHNCDLLLDQNFCLQPELKYSNLLPDRCIQCLGPQYALLNPVYVEERKNLSPRKGKIKRILIFFGGADPFNMTLPTLKILYKIERIKALKIDVVLGKSNPHKKEIIKYVENCPQITVHIQLPHLAFLLSQADLMIGSGGGATWERCCLGVVGIMLPYEKNQETIAKVMNKSGFAFIASLETLEKCVRDIFLMSQKEILSISNDLLKLTDGKGVQKIADLLG